MREPLTTNTTKEIVVVRMADDVHHLLERAAVACWVIAIFMALGVAFDLADRAWFSAAVSSLASLAFIRMGRESWTRRRKYAFFAKAARNGLTSPASTANGDDRG